MREHTFTLKIDRIQSVHNRSNDEFKHENIKDPNCA